MDDKTTDNFRLSCVKALHWLLVRYMEASLAAGEESRRIKGGWKKWVVKYIQVLYQ